MPDIVTWLLIALGLLVLAIVGAVFGVGRAIYSLCRLAATRRCAAQASKTLREGKLTEALAAYIKAEKKWQWNRHDGRRPSLMRDIELYSNISSKIFYIVGKPSAPVRSNVNAILAEMKAFLGSHPYFRTDPRKVSSDLLDRWETMCKRLETARPSVRNVGEPQLY